MRHTIAGIDDHARDKTLGVQRKHRLNGNIGRIESILLKHNL